MDSPMDLLSFAGQWIRCRKMTHTPSYNYYNLFSRMILKYYFGLVWSQRVMDQMRINTYFYRKKCRSRWFMVKVRVINYPRVSQFRHVLVVEFSFSSSPSLEDSDSDSIFLNKYGFSNKQMVLVYGLNESFHKLEKYWPWQGVHSSGGLADLETSAFHYF